MTTSRSPARPRSLIVRRVASLLLALPLCLSLVHGEARAEPAIVKASIKRLARALRCKGASDLSGFKVWCITTRFLSKGRAPALGKGVFFGMTVVLPKGKNPAQMVLGNISPAALVLRGSGAAMRGNLFSVKPSNPAERRMLVGATMNVTAQLKGKRRAAVVLAKPLFGYIGSMRNKARYRVTRAKGALVLHGASTGYIRRVGRAIVVVEVPKKGKGVFVSLFSAHIKSS